MGKSFVPPHQCFSFTHTRSLVTCLILSRSLALFLSSFSLSLSQTTNEASAEAFNNKIEGIENAAAAATGANRIFFPFGFRLVPFSDFRPAAAWCRHERINFDVSLWILQQPSPLASGSLTRSDTPLSQCLHQRSLWMSLKTQ